MAGRVKDANLESRTARGRLKRGRNVHWKSLVPGRVALGYQVWKAARDGRWILRRYIGDDKYRSETLGRADDRDPADGVHILSYEQADAKARSAVDIPAAKTRNLTVRQAVERYIEHKQHEGKDTRDSETRAAVHIYPDLGDLIVSELTTERLQRWLSNMADAPAQSRPKDNKPKYRAAPVTDEDMRRRRNTANRVLGILRAALNLADDEHDEITNRKVWSGGRLKPFRGVNTARLRYLNVAESQRLVNACDPDLRALVRAALETGARYGELGRLLVQDFNADAGTVFFQKTKPGKSRHVVLTEEGAEFFRQHCAGRAGGELMFTHNGSQWGKSDQARPMREVCKHARITPSITIHGMRHTWASLAVMAGTPLMVVARQLGHKDTRMVELHYGHLAPDYITDAIRAGAPRYGIKSDAKVTPFK
jgi:integrase